MAGGKNSSTHSSDCANTEGKFCACESAQLAAAFLNQRTFYAAVNRWCSGRYVGIEVSDDQLTTVLVGSVYDSWQRSA